MYLPGPPIAAADIYSTPVDRRRSLLARMLPDNVAFALYVARLVITSRLVVGLGRYDDLRWTRASQDFHDFLENMGARIEIEGMDHLRRPEGTAVFVANHMSTLETFYLPQIINPIMPVSFVIKPSLARLPLAGPVFRARKPIVVTRDNARKDLQIVLEEGQALLQSGRSVIVFPQSTRTPQFEPTKFNSLGVKLARRAQVPVIPIALKTDAWGLGRWIKDLGGFDRRKTVHFAIGAPLDVVGPGAETHREVTEFIAGKLAAWQEDETT